jgi:hypothetical protein
LIFYSGCSRPGLLRCLDRFCLILRLRVCAVDIRVCWWARTPVGPIRGEF